MGKTKRGHNWKARRDVETSVDRSAEVKIKVDISGVDKDDYDISNALVLPSQKRSTKVKVNEEKVVKRLSKKQRKKLEKIIQQKEKKTKRSELLDKLQTVQVSAEEMKLFTTTSEMHSGKNKRILTAVEDISSGGKISALGGTNKKRQKLQQQSEYSSSDTSSEESELEDDEKIVLDGKLSDNDTEKRDSDSLKDDEQILQKFDLSSPVEPSEVQSNICPDRTSNQRKNAVYIPLTREPEMQEQRLRLPILGEEQVIMEAINEHPVVILCGETGSGKTTQVPQFLYEAGYAHGDGIIGVTEPRRVAAISMSKRVAQEMNLRSKEVSYQIRYEGNVSPNTKIKFMTDGVLLKEVQKDFLLTKYKVVIIDEAHERSVFTDILIGLLSRIVPLRHKKGNPLKLIIMSATLRVEDFTENPRLFKVKPPVIKVDSRQYPVTIHFNKRTPVEDYLGECYKKICKIHRQLPEGGILVFVTGQQEVHTLCAKLKRTFPLQSKLGPHSKSSKKEDEEVVEVPEKSPSSLPDIKLEDYSILPLDEEAELQPTEEPSAHLSDEDMLASDAEENLDSIKVRLINKQEEPMFVLPLYSLLASDKQAKVFEPPPVGCRLVVVATNVAETSLTIPNIKYVIDTGKVKTKFYDKVTGVSAFRVTWTSQASANQRAGRAGRTGPGHTYRLYSSAVFSDFEKFSPPEITRRPVDDLILQMKAMCIDKVVNFPFPTPPDIDALKAAERLLVSLGALEKPPRPKSFKDTQVEPSTKVTSLGKVMAHFPVSPRYGKMLSLGHQHQLLPYIVAIVAALSVQEIFVEIEKLPTSDNEKEEQKKTRLKAAHIRRTWAGSGHSLLLGDLMVMLKAVGSWEYAGGSVEFCEAHGLRYKAMMEIRKLRAQLTNTVNSVMKGADVCLDPCMKPPTDIQAKLMRQVVLAGLGDHVARKLPEPPKGSEDMKKLRFAYQSLMLEDPVFIHPGSVLYKHDAEFVMYQYVEETSKLYMKGVSIVEAEWLPLFVANQCQFSKPAEDPSPRFNVKSGNVVCHMSSTFGGHFWSLPSVETEYPDGLDRYKWFARFFLEGHVCPKLVKFVPTLLTAPVTMIKTWAKLQPRTESMLNTLVSERVDNKQRLVAVWKKNPKYLLQAYAEWLPQALEAEVGKIWPPV